MNDAVTLDIVDTLAHEYGWTIDYIQGLDLDEINKLLKVIVARNKNTFRIYCSVIAHAINGKELKFNNSTSDTPILKEEEGLKDLMSKLGQKVKKD